MPLEEGLLERESSFSTEEYKNRSVRFFESGRRAVTRARSVVKEPRTDLGNPPIRKGPPKGEHSRVRDGFIEQTLKRVKRPIELYRSQYPGRTTRDEDTNARRRLFWWPFLTM